MGRWKERARRLKLELFALYLAARHPQTPWYARLALAVRFVPGPVLAECRQRAADRAPLRGRFSWVALAVVWLSVVVIGIAFYI